MDHIGASGHAPREQAGHMTCTRVQATHALSLVVACPSESAVILTWTRELLVATRLRSCPSANVAVDGDAFRCVPSVKTTDHSQGRGDALSCAD